MNINSDNVTSGINQNHTEVQQHKNAKVDIERSQIPPSGKENMGGINITAEQIKASEPMTTTEFRERLEKKDYEGLKKRISSQNVNASINGHLMQTVLHRIAMFPATPENLDLIRYFASKGADFNQLDLFGGIPLLEAIANAQPVTALAIAEIGQEYRQDLNKLPIETDPENPEYSFHNTALHLLMAKGYRNISADNQQLPISYLEVAEKLIAYGANPNVQDNNGNTPLHIAYLRHDKEEIALLINHGAKSDIANHDGTLPYEMSRKSYEDACQFLKIQAAAYLLDKTTFDAYQEKG